MGCLLHTLASTLTPAQVEQYIRSLPRIKKQLPAGTFEVNEGIRDLIYQYRYFVLQQVDIDKCNTLAPENLEKSYKHVVMENYTPVVVTAEFASIDGFHRLCILKAHQQDNVWAYVGQR